jgi:TolA-binding protein
MIRIFVGGALLAALGSAPLQCSHNPDPALRGEDDAGDALYALALDFRAKGDEPSARQTLAFLVQRYPSNRHVPEARAELGAGAADPKADAGK